MTSADSGNGSEAALRPLRAVEDEVDALRRHGRGATEARGRVMRVANGVDRSLRRLLRDDERAELEVRLKALAPDELSSDQVLGELRRNDRLPMEVAAAVHELFEIRRRLEAGADPTDSDARRAVETVERLKPATERLPAPAFVADSPLPEIDSIASPDDGTAPRRGRRRRAVPTLALAAGAALVALVVIGVWALASRGPEPMAEGIALFRTGAYADAAHHFWRYAEANPDDATPHLYLARIHRRMDRPELAAEAIREAQRLAPQDPAVHRELGFLLLDTGRPEVAVDRFREAVDLDPASSEGWVGLVRALRESGRADEIEAVLAEAPAEVRALLTQPSRS
ncbi:MAG: tetratricopeptide repeat protein [Gemmatimonadota bacterium]